MLDHFSKPKKYGILPPCTFIERFFKKKNTIDIREKYSIDIKTIIIFFLGRHIEKKGIRGKIEHYIASDGGKLKKYEKINQNTRNSLNNLFRHDVNRLSLLINKDLSHWK